MKPPLFVLLVYLALVLFIGLYSHRLFRPTGESYFVADRSIGPFVLLMSLFGTNMTAFAILGASAEVKPTTSPSTSRAATHLIDFSTMILLDGSPSRRARTNRSGWMYPATR